jgi:hypothetical protein
MMRIERNKLRKGEDIRVAKRGPVGWTKRKLFALVAASYLGPERVHTD